MPPANPCHALIVIAAGYTRNLRLTAIHSFFRYAAYEAPTHAGQIQRLLAIPAKRFDPGLVPFLTRSEVVALLAAPDQGSWSGRRDHALILLAVQTGLRLSELTGLQRDDIHLGVGAHVRVLGKGRKERCTPLSKSTRAVLTAWMRKPTRATGQPMFPNARGGRLSAQGMHYILAKYAASATKACPSLGDKRVTPHVLRYNDRYGHEAGDDCLKQVALALAGAVRGDDLVARYGGEEFAVVLRDLPVTEVSATGERLRAAIDTLGLPHAARPDGLGRVTVSIGAKYLSPGGAGSLAACVGAADEALYLSKRNGRNAFTLLAA